MKNRTSIYTIFIFSLNILINSFFLFETLIELIFNLPDSNIPILNISYLIIQLLSYIFYLKWYSDIDTNYFNSYKKHNSIFKNFAILDWFFPFFNIFFPAKTLSKIISGYLSKKNQFEQKLIHSSILIWAFSFLIWYAILIYQFISTPLFPEDIEIYYMLHPEMEIFFDLSYPIIAIIGLSAMISIMVKITKFEKSNLENDSILDISDHLV